MLPPALCYDNLSILTFSGAVKTIKGDHVEIIYICPVSQRAICSVHVCQLKFARAGSGVTSLGSQLLAATSGVGRVIYKLYFN